VEEFGQRIRLLRNHGMAAQYRHEIVGGNFRIDALQAALLRIKLRKLDEATEARTRNAGLYRELFLASGLADESAEGSGAFGLPIVSQNRHIFNQFTLRIRDGKRDALREHLGSKNIGTEIYYPVPLHLQECFADLGHQRGEFPHAERAADETIAIPIFPELSEDEIRYVAKQIIAFFGK
ncbi:MAG: DegT/DnrJ/EryC1/StrS family aminotransferase, partial [Planctomycetota bacterium]